MQLDAQYFSASGIERNSALRKNAAGLEALLNSVQARFLAVRESEPLCLNGSPVLLLIEQVRPPASNRALRLKDFIYLGEMQLPDGAPVHLFTFDVNPAIAIALPDDAAFVSGRELMHVSSARDAALLAYARAMLNWHHTHRHCGSCGAKTEPHEGGFVMQCSDCEHRSFPRLDPAIIVLVCDDERCLLGRQPHWPEKRYSTIAGFAEPGESLEDAVHRELHEETNISVTDIRYLGSQPWPFPAALMLGFHARAVSAEIRLNDGELADAAWFTREQLQSGEVVFPPQQSIAFQLIAAWHDAGAGIRLADVPQSESFNAPRA